MPYRPYDRHVESGASNPAAGASLEEELALLLAGTAARRSAAASRIAELAARVDPRVLATVLDRQALLPLLGTRLVALGPDGLPSWFARRVGEVVEGSRHRAALYEQATVRMLAVLADSGIAAVPLKGATLGQELYGDPALRPSTDIDLLVRRSDLDRAVVALEAQGFARPNDIRPVNGLPQLHYTLPHAKGWLPTVEVHWRIHWYETAFSEELVDRGVPAPDGGRRLTATDGMAALLLFYARDGLFGLRYPTDIAALWDARGGDIASGALDEVVKRHPELAGALSAATEAAERVVGVPAARLLTFPARNLRGRWASRLVNWSLVGEHDQLGANRSLIDGLLSPPRGVGSFARRQLFLPAEMIAQTYRLPDGADLRRRWWQLVHPPKLVLRFLLALWQIRGRRSWAPLPASAEKQASPRRFAA